MPFGIQPRRNGGEAQPLATARLATQLVNQRHHVGLTRPGPVWLRADILRECDELLDLFRVGEEARQEVEALDEPRQQTLAILGRREPRLEDFVD